MIQTGFLPGMLPEREATLSPDGVYRYTLGRRWSQGPRRAVFVCLNPSTADANVDDPTVRKCVGFAKRWGMDAMAIVNLFAFRATDPQVLKSAGYPVGPSNDDAIQAECATAELVVCAWGANVPRGHHRLVRVVSMIRPIARGGLFCLGTTDGGAPRHPLMLAYETPLIPFGGSNG